MDWREKHGQVIDSFLSFMNGITDRYILKGGTALQKCYNLTRFSEDIDLDGSNGNQIITICQNYCKNNGFSLRIAKNTDTVKRFMIDYNGIKPLKIELSSRRKSIPEEDTIIINGIKTYTINVMTELKVSAYQQRDKIRDLFDITFIINNYYNDLEKGTKRILRNALEYKGLEHFDYIISTQKDELINQDILASSFLEAYEKVGLLATSKEKEVFLNSVDEIDEEQKFER